MEQAMAPHAQLSFDRPDNRTLIVRLAGSWCVADGVPSPSAVQDQLESDPPVECVRFDTQNLGAWDTGLLIFLRKLQDGFANRQIEVDAGGLPDGARRLLNLAAAVPEKKDTGKGAKRTSFLALVGEEVIRAVASTVEMVRFIGEATIALGAFLRGKPASPTISKLETVFKLARPFFSTCRPVRSFEGCRHGSTCVLDASRLP
jgi:phospholipid/cholesterol/gamma-HCH transport system permease protein